MSWLADAEVTTKKDRESTEQSKLLSALENERKAVEALGVTVNGVPYSGDPANRAALAESIQYAREDGLTHFDRWKDSEGGFHPDYPLSDVIDGSRQIGCRRSKLIAREAEYAAQIEAGTLTDVEGLDWEV